MKTKKCRTLLGALAAAAVVAGQPTVGAAADPFSIAIRLPDRIELYPADPNLGHLLRIQIPDGTVVSETFGPGEVVAWPFDAENDAIPDGNYTFEARSLAVAPPLRRDASARRRTDPGAFSRATVGYFTVRDGSIIPADLRESVSAKALSKATVLATDDGVIRNGLCVGFDCPNSPSFNADTIRLEENNLRIHFSDTSTDSFPGNDWRLLANDSTSGGGNYFGVEDSTSGRRIFTLEAAAPSNSLYVDSAGDVGFGTATPALDIHKRSGDSPAIRLEQDTSGGFTAQTWDIAGNETNFFVRDVTHSSNLPFRIRPGAPDSAIDISGSGEVGMGLSNPESALHVRRSDGSARLLVEETSGIAGARELFKLKNNGGPFFIFENTDLGESYSFAMGATGHFLISHQQTAGVQMRLRPNGNLEIAGTLTEGSSRDIKDNVAVVDSSTVLAKLDELEISEWNYAGDDEIRHIGPMAEEFYGAFGLGPNAKHIAPKDLAGIALAAAKALNAETKQLRMENEALNAENREFRMRLERIEAKLNMR